MYLGDPDAVFAADIIDAFGAVDDDDTNGFRVLGPPPPHVRDALIEQLRRASVSNEGELASQCSSGSPSSRLLTVAELLAAPPARYIVKDLLPERGLLAIYGAPAAGKSFLTIDLAFAIAVGRSHWFGRRLGAAPVAYVILEGKGNFQKRVRAHLAHTGEQASLNLRFYPDRLSLLDQQSAEALGDLIRQELGSGCVVIIDTLSRACPGGDENSSIDMTTAITNAELIGEIVDGPVILVHHTGKEAGKGMRGHSALLGAVDGSIEVVSANGLRSWTLRKNKDGEDGGVFAFDLVTYPVGSDQWGDEMTSCAVRPLPGATLRQLPPVNGKHRITAMAVIRPLSALNPAGIDYVQARAAVAAVLTVDHRRRNTVAKDTIDGLVGSGHLQQSSDKIIVC